MSGKTNSKNRDSWQKGAVGYVLSYYVVLSEANNQSDLHSI
jgi:hypothetical protein